MSPEQLPAGPASRRVTNPCRFFFLLLSACVLPCLILPAAAHAQIYRPFAQRHAATQGGDLFMLANTVLTCQNPTGSPATCGPLDDNQTMVNAKLAADAGDASVFNSSSSDLSIAQLPAGSTILHAQLYWGGIVAAAGGQPVPVPANTAARLAAPGAAYGDVMPADCALSAEMSTFGSGNHFLYQCTADVTARLQAGGLGTWKVANVPVETGKTNRFAGWTIVIVARKPGGTLRNFTINDGLAVIRNVAGATSVSIPISGFTTPLAGPVTAQIGAVAYDGDRSAQDAFRFTGQGSPTVALSDACNPATDEFNSSICHLGATVATRSIVNNNLQNTLGFDADIIQLANVGNVNLGNGVSAATITASTPSEGYFLGVVTTAIDVYQPAFEGVGVKTLSNLSHPTLPVGYAYPGDVIRYEISARNIGLDTATDVSIDDAIPAGTTYVPGSLAVVAGANAGAKTDVQGDDQADFDAGVPGTRFRIGVGANAVSGGLIRCPTCPGTEPTSSSIRFDVAVDAGVAPGSVIGNVARIAFAGVASGQDYETDTNEASFVVVSPAIGVAKQAGPLVDNGDGSFTVSLLFTLENLSPASAGAAGSLSGVQVADDLDAVFPAPGSFSVGAVAATGSLVPNPTYDGASDTNLLVAASSTLAAGSVATITLDVTFAPGGVAGPFLNQALASASDAIGSPVSDLSNDGTQPDPDGDGDPDGPGENEPTPIAGPSADLHLAKSVDDPAPPVGSAVVYTLALGNDGPNSASGITVSDALPDGLVFVASGGVGTYDAASGTWTVGALAAGASATLTITANVAPGGNYLNVAEIASSNVFDPDSTPDNGDPTEDDHASAGIAPIPVADVSLLKTGPANVASGGIITYTLLIANAGPSAADGATWSDAVPAAVTDVAASCGSIVGGAACSAPVVAGNTVSGVLPLLPAGSSVVITLTGRAPIGETALTNTATVEPPAGTSDPDQANNTSTVGTLVAAAADLAVSKSVDDDAPNIGESITFTVAVLNNGPDDATGVMVADALPAGLVFVSATPSQGTYADASGAWDVGALADGATAELLIVATVDQAGPITNTATRTAADQDDPDDSNNSGSASINGQPSADLRVLKTVDDASPGVGENVTFAITVSNAGPSDATGVSLSDALPAGSSFVSATPEQGSYDAGTGVWTIGTIANGESVSLQIVAVIEVATPITNVATIATSDQFDPNTTNNSGGVTVNGESADLQVVKAVDEARPLPGDTIAFTIVVTNNGPDDATGVEVVDALPPQTTFVSASASQGNYDAGSGAWAIGSLAAAGSAATATLTILASVESVDGFVNTASIAAADQPDPVPTNNSSDVAVNPGAVADVSIAKTAPALVASGASFDYRLLISNAGPSSADGATYVDVVPSAITGIAATCGAPTGGATCAIPAVSGNTVSGAVPVLPSGGSVTITISGTAPAGAALLANTATVQPPSGTDDPDPSDNSSGANTEVGASADISVEKEVDNATPALGEMVSFTITVANAGPDGATGVLVNDVLPAGLGFVSASASQGSYDAGTGGWSVGMLADGASAVLQIQATVGSAASIVNTATYTGGDVADPDPSNDSDSAAINPVAIADLALVKSGPASVAAGASVTYSVTLTNNGPGEAVDVVIADATPPGLVFGGNSGDCATAYPCAFATLAAGASLTINSTYAVPADYAGPDPVVNSASVSSATEDPVNGNDSSTVQTDVVAAGNPVADLAVSKTGPATVQAGDPIRYAVVVTNAGPDEVADAVLEDPTPAGLVFVASSAPCSGGFPCAIGLLAAGGSRTIQIDFTVPVDHAGGVVLNTASVRSPTIADPEPGNDASTVATTVTIGGGPGPGEPMPVPLDARWMLVLLAALLASAALFGRPR